MSTVHKAIEVDVPARVAYAQWSRFEDFPRFMDGVEEVEQVDDETYRWRVTVAGVDRTFLARVEEHDPERRIAWRATEGEEQGGAVTFEPLDSGRTRVTLELAYDPDDWAERVADALDLVERRAARDLERFKAQVEREAGDGPTTRGAADAAGQPEPDTEGLPEHPGEGRGDPVQDPSRRL